MERKELPSRIHGKGVAIEEGVGHQGWSPSAKEYRGEENGQTGKLTEGLHLGGVSTPPPHSSPYSYTRLKASHKLLLGIHPKLLGSLLKKLNELSEES